MEQRDRERLRLYGRYDRYVDPTPAQEHVARLRDRGMGTRAIAAAAGVDRKLVQALDRRVRISRVTRDRVLAVTGPILRPRAIAGQDESDQARQRLRALVAAGWSVALVESRLSYSAGNLTRMITGDRPILVGTARAVAAVYADLSAQQPPESTPHERAVATRARRYARERGWLAPIDLDYAEIDDPGRPVIDHVAIERRMAGDKSVRLTTAERVVLVDHWLATGRPLNECQRVAGLNPRRYLTKEAAA